MRRIVQLLTAAVLALSIAACATTTDKQHSYRSIKCPACGYEFDKPAKN